MNSPSQFLRLVAGLHGAGVRFVMIGVAGANYFAESAANIFTTADRDLYLPPESDACLAAWGVCEGLGLELSSHGEPLDQPRDRWLADAIVSRRALVRASDRAGLDIDLTLVMAGFEFEEVWRERRAFQVDGVAVPVARLEHIIKSKAAADRPKDRLFLATHEEALRDLRRLDG